MILRSDRWHDLARRSHAMTETVEILDHTGQTVASLDLVGGDVTEDLGATIRHTATLEAVDPTGTLTPTDLHDLLAPTGTRARISRGVAGLDADDPHEAPVPLATVLLTQTTASLDADGRTTIPLQGLDRAGRLQWPTTRSLALHGGQPVPAAIVRALRTVDPTLDVDVLPETPATIPRLLYAADTDMWGHAVEIAATIGSTLAMSRLDRLTMPAAPTIGTPVWRISEDGDAPGTSWAVNAQTVDAADQIPNGVIVIGQHSSLTSVVRGEAWDLNPRSPTYRYGTYGDRPRWIYTDKANTQRAAGNLAREVLQAVGGAAEVDVDVYPPPYWLTVGDTVEVDLPTIGAVGRYLLWRNPTPLGDPNAAARVTLRRSIDPEDMP